MNPTLSVTTVTSCLVLFALAGGVVATSGCAGARGNGPQVEESASQSAQATMEAAAAAEEPDDPGPALTPPLPDPRERAIIVDGRSGIRLNWTTVVGRMSLADVVLIGEQHGHPMGLHTAAELWEDLVTRVPNAALSLEFFERDDQLALDDYLTGITDETTFTTVAGRSSGNYPSGHRSMVETAREHQRPVIASNAPRRYVRLARTEGYERLQALTPEQRRLFVIPETLPSGPYRDRFFDLMGGMMMSHGAPEPAQGEEGTGTGGEAAPDPHALSAEAMAEVEGFFRSQVMWDTTMAASLKEALADGLRPVVHVVGQFHTDHEGGLAAQLRSMSPRADVVTISMVDAWADALRPDDADRADFIIYVGPRPEEGAGMVGAVSMSAEPR